MNINPSKTTLFLLIFSLCCITQLSAQPAFRSIFRGTSGGSTTSDYFEIEWTPNTDLSGYSVVFIQGSGGDCGEIADFVSLSGYDTGANGILLYRGFPPVSPGPDTDTEVIDNIAFTIPNTVRTFFIVENLSQSPGADADTNDDGMIDGTFSFGTSVADALSIEAGTSCVYADEVIGGTVIDDAGYTPDILFLDGGSWFGANTDPGSGMNEIVVTPGEAHGSDGTAAPQFDGQMLTAGATSSPLPIELLSFQAKQVGSAIHLAWETITEKNNALMVVERSKDGRSFVEIGQRKGAGTTLTPQRYGWVDEQPFSGINYYRLRQQDYDGAVNYHSTIAVLFKSDKQQDITIFPSLVSDQLNIALGEAIKNPGALRIVDMMGRVMQEALLGAGTQQETLDVSNLQGGRYYLSLQAGREILMASFVKQ